MCSFDDCFIMALQESVCEVSSPTPPEADSEMGTMRLHTKNGKIKSLPRPQALSSASGTSSCSSRGTSGWAKGRDFTWKVLRFSFRTSQQQDFLSFILSYSLSQFAKANIFTSRTTTSMKCLLPYITPPFYQMSLEWLWVL